MAVKTDITCMACGCLCDGLPVHVEEGKVVAAEVDCDLGRAWLESHTADPPEPVALVDGKPATLDAAVDAAVEILDQADMPLVYGLGHLSCEAQQAALALAEEIGGVVDGPSGSTELATQLWGKVTCSLGEVKNRADLVIYWGANPAQSHPLHMARYTLEPKGKYVPEGRRGRTMVLVDVCDTLTAQQADLVLRVRPGKDFEVLTALRAVVQGERIDAVRIAETGLALPELEDLAHRMKSARFGVIFFGRGLTATRGGCLNAGAVQNLVTELNAFTKFAAMAMHASGNGAGAAAAMLSTFDYPSSVDLSRGYPRANPGEFSAAGMLERGECDAVLALGDDPGATLSAAAARHLAKTPTVVIGPHVPSASRLPRVHIPTAVAGISAAGTAYRMDGVPLPLVAPTKSPYPTAEEVLGRICGKIQAAVQPRRNSL